MYPVLFEFGGIKIFSYPLFMGMAWGLGYKICLMNPVLMEKGSFRGLFWGTFFFAWLGAKIFFLFSNVGNSLEYYWTTWNFWKGGGFVFYGGLIFGTGYVLIYSLVLKKFPSNRLAWLLPALGLGHALGRVGCFLSGCCFGLSCDLPWAIYLNGQYRHPVTLYEAVLLVLLSVASYKLLKNKTSAWSIIGFYFITYALGRFILEFFRGDWSRGIYLWGLSFSQIISAGLLGLGALAFLLRKKIIFLFEYPPRFSR